MYQSRNLSVIGYANGFTLWHYASPDPVLDVMAPGYFNNASDMLRTGDFLFCNLNTEQTARHGHLVVVAAASNTVDVAAPGFENSPRLGTAA